MRRNQVLLSTLNNVTLQRKLRKFNKLIDTAFNHLDIIYAYRSDQYNWYVFRFYQILDESVYLVFSEPVNCHAHCYSYLKKHNPKKYITSLGHLLANVSLSEEGLDEELTEPLIEQHMLNRREQFIDKWKGLKKE